MTAIPIKLDPGINTEKTAALNATGFSESSSIRFFQGLAQKTGGFRKLCQAPLNPSSVELGRSVVALHAWSTLAGILDLAIAGENVISLYQADAVSDITPLMQQSLIAPRLSTTAGSQTVTIEDLLNAPVAGDWIRIRAPISVGGVVLYGPYEVAAVVDNTHYTITAATEAAATVVASGATRVFSATVGSRVVRVVLANHGLVPGQVVRIGDPVAVGGVVLEGNYVASIIGPNTFEITDDETALLTETVPENGGNLALTFYNPRSNAAQGDMEVEFVALDNWGEFLVAIPKDGPIYVWQPKNGANSPLENTLTAPQANTYGFVASQQQILVVCGSVTPFSGVFDPMLVRWSDVGDYTEFTAAVTNQAGSLRLQLGSACIAGLAIAGKCMIWTDLAVYVMQYEGLPLVWGFQPVGINCGLIGPNAVGVQGDNVVWMSNNQFFVSAGGAAPQNIPCPIWDRVFPGISAENGHQTVCVTNSYFNEVTWYVPQADGTTVAARLQVDTGSWDYTRVTPDDLRNRSAGIDQNVFGSPLGASADGSVYREETGNDADTSPLQSRLLTGISMLSDSDDFMQIESIQPDVKFSDTGTAASILSSQFATPGPGKGTLQMTVYVYRNPQEAPRTKGPYMINSRTRSIPCRARGRGVQFEFASTDLDSFWRLGRIAVSGQIDGKGG